MGLRKTEMKSMGITTFKHYTARLCASLVMVMSPGLTAQAKSPPGADVTPAVPTFQPRPDFPATCVVAAENAAENPRVALEFDITRDGTTENVTVVESNVPCFNQASMDAVRLWKYTPQKMKGRSIAQEKVRTRFVFALEAAAETTMDFVDVSPIYRVPPRYPESCQDRASKLEYVVLQFTVTAEGKPIDPEVIENSSRCFIRAATRSVEKWLYRPAKEDGKPVARENVVQRISFQLVGPRENPFEVRRGVITRVKGAGRSLRNGDLDKAEEKIAEMIADYGHSLSKTERSLIYQIRGGVRLERGDYPGALDDLRYVRAHGVLDDDTRINVGKAITQLEKAVGVRNSE